jgi:hypothetical protein
MWALDRGGRVESIFVSKICETLIETLTRGQARKARTAMDVKGW